MKSQTIKFRLGLAFTLLIAILVAVGWLALDRMERVKTNLNYLVQHCWHKVELSRQAFGYSTANNRITLAVFLMTNSTDIDRLLLQRKQNTEKISELFTNLQQVLDSKPERNLLANIDAARWPYVASYQAALKLQFQDHQPDAARAMMVQVTLPLLVNYHAAWNAFVEFQGRQMEESARVAEQDYEHTRAQMLVLMLLALTGAMGIMALTTRKILSETFQRQRAEQELHLAHNELEARIQQRTAELNTANAGLSFEIAERARTEAKLAALQSQQERILTAIGEGLHGIDREGKIMFENPAATAMLGWEAQELIGQPAHQVMHHTRADGTPYPVTECAIYATLHDGLTHRVENEVFWRKDGTSFPVIYTSTPIRDEAGAIVGAVVAFRDITELKRDENKLRTTLSELERFNRVMINREQRVVELKREINQLLTAAGQPPAYPSVTTIAGGQPAKL